jgi:hypothetical protein
MSNQEYAFPIIPPLGSDGLGSAGGYPYPEGGLTKRELLAAMAMQGSMAAAAQQRHIPTVVADSVKLADALLAELAK